MFFAPTQTAVLRCKTRRHWLCQWRPDTAMMSPLRAVVSRGHIAENLLTAGFLLGRPCKDLAFAASVFPATPKTAARKAPRLCSGRGYPIRWRCRRLHITRGHIAQQYLTARVPHCIRARHRLTADSATTRAGSQRLRVFRSRTNGSAPLQNPKTLALPVAIRCRQRCRRCEPWFLAATSPRIC